VQTSLFMDSLNAAIDHAADRGVPSRPPRRAISLSADVHGCGIRHRRRVIGHRRKAADASAMSPTFALDLSNGDGRANQRDLYSWRDCVQNGDREAGVIQNLNELEAELAQVATPIWR
jgi:hypothetical protein